MHSFSMNSRTLSSPTQFLRITFSDYYQLYLGGSLLLHSKHGRTRSSPTHEVLSLVLTVHLFINT
jgi:hypothetical protein